MTTSPVPQDPDATVDDLSVEVTPATETTPARGHTGSPDPITGEPDAHPIGVGVGAGIAGAIGAAVGVVAGPIGVIVGAAIGAIAGGLAGKEVAESPEVSPTETGGAPLDEFDHSPTEDAADAAPLSKSLSDHLTPREDAFLTGGSLSGRDSDAPTDALDGFDRPQAPAVTAARPAPHYDLSQNDDHPLPTASGGVITPDESSFFEDSTTGESAVLTESPFPAAHAVSPGDHFGATAVVPATPTFADHVGAEQAVRTGAYYRYLGREASGETGSAFDDWIAAEQEVLGA